MLASMVDQLGLWVERLGGKNFSVQDGPESSQGDANIDEDGCRSVSGGADTFQQCPSISHQKARLGYDRGRMASALRHLIKHFQCFHVKFQMEE
jgi:hypothetical protein